jgi:hypothetical protein
MNGQERAVRQLRAGVRDLVTEIDALQLLLGITNVNNQTPKAEVTLRKGEKCRIPLILSCTLSRDQMEVTFVFPIAYPAEPFEVQEIKYYHKRVYDEEHRAKIHELCVNAELRESNDIHSALDFAKYIRNLSNFSHSIAGEDLIVQEDQIGDAAAVNITEEPQDMDIAVTEGVYRTFFCRMCRTALFTDMDLDFHKQSDKTCQTLFLSDPPKKPETASEKGGKIACPKCKAKLGAWNWVGTQCSCE